MNRIDAQDFLDRLEMLRMVIPNKLAEQAQWREIADNLSANMERERVNTSGSKSKMAEAVHICVDMESEIVEQVKRLRSEYRQSIQMLERLKNPTEYNVLHKRYVQGTEFQDIADEYGKEYTWATTTHGRAKKNLQIILNKVISL